MERAIRKSKEGVVVSAKMDKTAVISVSMQKRHRLYGKSLRRETKFKAHDEKNQYKEGDVVLIRECRPLSKGKCYRVIKKVK